MLYCRRCGAQLEDNMSYCPKCGTPVAVQQSYQPVRHEGRTFSSLVIIIGVVIASIVVIVLALIALGLIPTNLSPIIGSGNLQTRQVALSDFTAVDVSSGFNVQIVQASTYGINITADDNVLQYIDVNKTGSTLVIRLRPGIGFTTSTLRAEISMPELQEVLLSGGVVGNALNFDMTDNCSVELTGGSRLTMTGQAGDLTALCSGGANLSTADFKVNNANVDLSGGSQATIYSTGRLDANLSGGSQLFYKNNPTLGNITTSGGSSINQLK